MSSTAPLEVKVVYDARTAGRKGGATRAYTVRGGGRAGWIVLGLLNLAAAGGLCYGAWWKVDRELIYPTLVMKTSFRGVDLSGGVFVSRGTDGNQAEATEQPRVQAGQVSLDPKAVWLWSSAYGWLTLVTAASVALALSGGALIGRAGGRSARRFGLLVTLAMVVGLGVAAWVVVQQYGFRYPASYQRTGMACLAVLAAGLGLGVGGGVRGLTYFAAFVVILSGLGSAAALYLGHRADAVPASQAAPVYLAAVFLVHSLWGWLLLPIARRLRA